MIYRKNLTVAEKEQHVEDEAIIERGLKSFYEVGSALLRIRERRSYRDQFGTFEEYCRGRWDISASRARQLGLAAKTVDNLKSVTNVTILPTTESQCRPLADLSPEDQKVVWKRVVDSGNKITAVRIRMEVEAFRNDKAAGKPGADDTFTHETGGPHEEQKENTTAWGGQQTKEKGEDRGWEGQEEYEDTDSEYEQSQDNDLDWEELLRAKIRSIFNLEIEEAKFAKIIIDAGYRYAAKRFHPDHGGSHKSMVALNHTREKLKRAYSI